MPIRSYQTGDEHAQARIYNAAAGALPGFKPATAEEITRRYQQADPHDGARYFAIEHGELVGYALFGSNGRVSYPWCLPGSEIVREPLLETLLIDMRKRGLREAWAAYRGDWSPVLQFLRQHDFREIRTMVNYVADLSRLGASVELPSNRQVVRLEPEDLPRLIALAPELFRDVRARELEQFYWHDPVYNFPENLFALKDNSSGAVLGVYLLVASDRFADPTKIDAAMPCFRLGAFGTERERHKRVNGLFSCAVGDVAEAELILTSSAAARATELGLARLAAQAPSDAVALCAWYDRRFHRQGSFPILSRRLAS
jgi:hypothetical protein